MRRSALPGLLAALLIGAPAAAHLRTPYTSVGITIERAERLAIVRVVANSEPTPEGSETAVERVVDVVGTSAPAMRLVQRGPHPHHLRAGQVVLAPLGTSPAGRWLYLGDTRRPLELEERTARATVRFVHAWRAEAERPASDRVDEWIALTRNPSAIARRAGFEALTRHADDLRSLMSLSRLELLAAPLEEPEVTEAQRAAVIRLLDRLGGADAADLLAHRFPRLTPPRIRYLAAGVIGRHLTPLGRQTLSACATREGDPLAGRCGRLLARAAEAGAR